MKKLMLCVVTFLAVQPFFLLAQTAEIVTFNGEEISSQALSTAVAGVKELKTGIDEITKELFALDEVERARNQDLDKRYRIARNEIVRVISSIDEATTNILTSIKKLATYQSQMKVTMDQLAETRQSSSVAKEYFAEYLNLVYRMQLETYDRQGNSIDEFRLLLTSDNVNRTLVSKEIAEAMTVQLAHLIEQADQDEEKKVELLAKLGGLKQLAQKTLTSYYDEIERLQQKKQYLINFMQLYRDKQMIDQQRFDKIFASKRDVHDTIQVFLDEIVKKDYKSVDGIATQITELASLPDASDHETAPIAWPIYPIEKILRYFNDASFEQEHGFKHQGIQIQAEQRTPVYAVRDGVVYHTFNNVDSISRIMIVHQRGYVSTYQYLNQILVQPGDIVYRGQIIGYSGGEPGTSGAGFVSEGENLTFGVYKDGVAIDPLTILDLSVVTDWEKVLPDEYRIKYLNDHLVRPIDVSELKLISGTSVDERAQKFIYSYGVGIYRDLSFRDSVVVGTNIDRDMVICVAFAESTLGRYLSTDNNIGNVGNNDRWDRIAYGSPYDWARLIALTLNNQWLGHYHTIKQLSRYGNADGKIYASSPINWQTNVLKCLSKIKGYTIPEDFPFRTGPNPNRL